MFYLVSKIAWFFVTPSNLLTTLTIAGLVLMWLGRATIGFRLAAGPAPHCWSQDCHRLAMR